MNYPLSIYSLKQYFPFSHFFFPHPVSVYVSLASMADVIRLSSNSVRLIFSSSSPCLLPSLSSYFNTLPASIVPNHNLVKRVCTVAADSASSSMSISVGPRKRLGSFKVHAAVTETEQPRWWEKNAGPNMIDIHSTQEFLSALSQAGDRLVVVEFYGTWCASCRALFPKLCRTAVEHPGILFLKVNFDENKPMCKSLNVKVLPYFHFYLGADGQVDGFSCSLNKFQKIKDAIALHNRAPSNAGPSNGVPGLHHLRSLTGDMSAESATT